MTEPHHIQREIDETRSSLTEKLELLENRLSETVESTKAAVTETVDSVTETVTETVDNVKESVSTAFDVRGHIENRPWAAMGVATVAGFFLGRWLGGAAGRHMPSMPHLHLPSMPSMPRRPHVFDSGESHRPSAATHSSFAASPESSWQSHGNGIRAGDGVSPGSEPRREEGPGLLGRIFDFSWVEEAVDMDQVRDLAVESAKTLVQGLAASALGLATAEAAKDEPEQPAQQPNQPQAGAGGAEPVTAAMSRSGRGGKRPSTA